MLLLGWGGERYGAGGWVVPMGWQKYQQPYHHHHYYISSSASHFDYTQTTWAWQRSYYKTTTTWMRKFSPHNLFFITEFTRRLLIFVISSLLKNTQFPIIFLLFSPFTFLSFRSNFAPTLNNHHLICVCSLDKHSTTINPIINATLAFCLQPNDVHFTTLARPSPAKHYTKSRDWDKDAKGLPIAHVLLSNWQRGTIHATPTWNYKVPT